MGLARTADAADGSYGKEPHAHSRRNWRRRIRRSAGPLRTGRFDQSQRPHQLPLGHFRDQSQRFVSARHPDRRHDGTVSARPLALICGDDRPTRRLHHVLDAESRDVPPARGWRLPLGGAECGRKRRGRAGGGLRWRRDRTSDLMKIEGEGKLLRIFIGESDTWHGRPLYEAIVRRVREAGLAGATVIRGIEGFGADSHLHTSRILRLSEDLPVVIEVVDAPERIDEILPVLDEMIGEGMVTLERVEIVAYRSSADT